METHSSILAQKFPWTEEPGGLQSLGLQSQTQLSKQLNFHLIIIKDNLRTILFLQTQ